MIICELKGGFGNHLLNYGLACVLANKYNLKIYIISNAILNDPLYQRNDTRTTIFKVINYNYIDNTSTLSNIINITTEVQFYNLLNNLDKSKSYKLNIIGTILPFYTENINIIKNYTNFDYKLKFPNSIVISLRLGMGKNETGNPSPFIKDLRLPFIYYKKSIEYFLNKNKNINKLIVCSDNFEDNYLQNFYNLDYKLDITLCDKKNTLEQFEIIINADYFISSNSTYSLLASVFNTSGSIITPDFKGKYSQLNTNARNCFRMPE